MLNYALYPNELTQDDPNDQMARPVDITTRDIDELVTKVTGPGSILKPTETKAVIDAYWDAIGDYIRAGEAYSDDYINTRFDISGVFQNADDKYDSARHTVVVGARLKPNVSSRVNETNLRKVNPKSSQPVIDSVYDWGSDSSEGQVTPGDTLEISGEMLKIHGNLDEEGVFFINLSDNSETLGERLRTNEPKTLTLRIPALSAGNYRLEVRNTRYDGKTLRIGIFGPTLSVAGS